MLKSHGGIFGRNPEFKTVVIDGGTALDFFEQGTWDPTYVDSGAAGSYTYDIQAGEYIRIGNLVYVFGTIRTDSVGSPSGTISIGGLPFTVSTSVGQNDSGLGIAAAISIQGFTTQAPEFCEARANTTTLGLGYYNGGVSVSLPAANLGTGTNANRLRFSCTYFTS